MNDDQRRHIKRLLEISQQRLRVLEQQAKYFGPKADAHILMEIDSLRTEVASYEQQLGITRSTTEPSGQRCADLATHIGEALELIKEYEDQRRVSGDPKERRRADQELARLQTELSGYQQERTALGCAEG